MSIEEEFGEELGGDPVEGGDNDGYDGGSDDDGGGGGGSIPGFGDIAPSWLTSSEGILRSFLANPQNFIVGAVAATILETVFGVVTTALNVVFLVFGGSAPGRLNAPGETLGLVDVPVFVADQLTGVGASVGNTILVGIESLNEPLFELASSGGPLTPLIVNAVFIVEVIVVLWILQRVVYVVADLFQIGGLTE